MKFLHQRILIGKFKDELKEELNKNYLKRKEKSFVLLNEKEYEMPVGKLFLNILLLKSFAEFSIMPEEEDLFQGSQVTQAALNTYFNHLIQKFRDNKYQIDYDEIRTMITETMNEMSDVSGNYNIYVGNSISFRDLIRLEVEDSEFNELAHTKVKPGQFNDIEKQFNELGKKLMNYFIEHKETELHPFVASETGINKKQFCQAIGFVGLKPSMSGEVIPVTITDNFLRGLSGIDSYYINACGTRKALTTNQKYTKRSGYLTRKLELSNVDNFHDNSIFDCGTRHTVLFNVNSKEKLRQIIGRHYYETNDAGENIGELKTVSEESTFLIGKKIGLRSPVTCCSQRTCATCYGKELSAVNKDINTGLAATLKLTEPLTQTLLSAKHCVTCC